MAELFFPPATLSRMAKIGLSEADVEDAFNHGEDGKTADSSRVVVKKYHGYEVGLFYAKANKISFDYVVTAVWKRDRR